MRLLQAGRTLNKGWPNSTGLAFSTKTWVMTPLTSALISFITFIASMMQTTRVGIDLGADLNVTGGFR